MVIGQPIFLICDKHRMTDKAEVTKWFAGREIDVLDDQKGRTTVSAWREQLLNAAGRMCGATGRKMLQGEFPSIEENTYYTPEHLMNVINDVFKRSKTREKMNNWFIEDDDGNLALSWFGYNEFNVQVSTIAEDLLDMIMLTLKEGSDAATYLKSLMRRSGTTVSHLQDFHKYSTTTMVRGARSAKKAVGVLLRDVRVVRKEDGDMPNPNDMTPSEFATKFTTFEASMGVQKLFTGLEDMCRLYDSLHTST